MEGFLDKVSGLLDKGLLLAALFPLLITGFIVVLGGATVLGWRATLFWLESLSTATTATATTFLAIVLLLGSFVLRSLRRPILSI
jgi:hypothetical protein